MDELASFALGAGVAIVSGGGVQLVAHKLQIKRDREERAADIARDDRTHLRDRFEQGAVALRAVFRSATPRSTVPEEHESAVRSMRTMADSIRLHLDQNHPVNAAYEDAMAALVDVSFYREETPARGRLLSPAQHVAHDAFVVAFERYTKACREHLAQ